MIHPWTASTSIQRAKQTLGRCGLDSTSAFSIELLGYSWLFVLTRHGVSISGDRWKKLRAGEANRAVVRRSTRTDLMAAMTLRHGDYTFQVDALPHGPCLHAASFYMLQKSTALILQHN
jgi:hypothetical protein